MTRRDDMLLERLREVTLALRETQAELDALECEPVAIVGMGCRFPGGADGPTGFWALLEDGRDAVQPLAPRWALVGAHPGEDVPRWAGLLSGAVDGFDAAFFGISPREARSLDPQQRLLLEVAWEALEDAGVVPRSLAGSRTGVFVGACFTDYRNTVSHQPREEQDAYSVTGNMLSVAAGRLSYTLGLQGPCLTVDTACSSSLVAIHLACRHLRTRESDLALAGGVNLLLSPDMMDSLARTQAFSPDGRCKTFDASANGTVRGEGCGLVVLKRLSDARRDGDRIWALIRGSAVNQDGRSTGLTAPNVLAQQALLREALQRARVEAGDIGYVETHGTGTSLGDPIEIEALRAVVGSARPDGTRCMLGAVKTNLGHPEAAAGVAGLIKAALVLHHERIPKNLNFRTLNPRIRLEGTALALATEPVAWPRTERPRFAGVSSFGLSGTNAHVVLEEAPVSKPVPSAPERGAELFVLSAKSDEALSAQAARLRDHLQMHPEQSLGDVAFSLATTRSPMEHRLASAVTSREALQATLEAAAHGQTPPGAVRGRASAGGVPKVVFVFPGQGSQWLGMGRQLYASEPVFRAALEACDAAVARHVGWSLLAELHADAASSRMAAIEVVQPLLFAMSVALAALWRAWGIEPDAVVGHSMGEIAAAHVAGALSLEDAAAVVCRRSRLLTRAMGLGAMAIAELTLEQAAEAIRGYEGRVAIGGSNSPRTTILSGELGALEELAGVMLARDVFFRIVRGTVPSHSPKVAFLGPELLEQLAELRPRAGTVPICSTVSGEVTDGAGYDAGYWLRNLLEPVRFAQSIERLACDGHQLFVEVSAHPVLLGPLQQTLAALPVTAQALGSIRIAQDERRVLLESLGAAYVAGVDPRWEAFFTTPATVVPLPTYPWQRERFWMEAPQPARARRSPLASPLLGEAFSDSLHAGCRTWQARIGPDEQAWVGDHQAHDACLLPAAAFLEMSRAAAIQALESDRIELSEIALLEAMIFPQGGARDVQTVWTPLGDEGMLHISSREAGQSELGWTLHMTARARRSGDVEPRTQELARDGEHVSGAQLYAELRAAGFQYGPSFRGLVELWKNEEQVLGRVVPPLASSGDVGLPPAILDALLQVCLPLLDTAGQGVWVPVSAERWRLWRRSEGELWSTARLRAPVRPGEPAEVDVTLFDDAGAPLGELTRLALRPLSASARPTDAEGPYLGVRWVEAPLREGASVSMGARATPNPGPAELAPRALSGRWLVVAPAGARTEALVDGMRARGADVLWASPRADDAMERGLAARVEVAHPGAFEQLLGQQFSASSPCSGVVVAAGLDDTLEGGHHDEAAVGPKPHAGEAVIEGPASLAARVEESLFCLLHLVQALGGTAWRRAPRLCLVSRGAVPAAGDVRPHQAPLLGLGAVLPYEHPELRSKRVDLSVEPDAVELAALVRELALDDGEEAVALRGARRFVGRFARWGAGDRPSLRPYPMRTRPFRLALARKGSLEDLQARPLARRPVAPGEVEIEVEATGLNFFDVVRALGLIPGLRDAAPDLDLGVECAGRVAAVGEGVHGLAVGDPVVAIARGSLASHVHARVEHVVPRPPEIDAREAAALPAVYATAWYALGHVARLSAGERVLIHAATGGTGLAALHIARSLGAEIYATAGSEAKRALLRELGVRHVYDSRTLDFGRRILEDTGGEGVDVVLNSLAGLAVEESLRALATDGRFLELGKRDIYAGRPLGLDLFKRRLSYTAIDVLGLAEERPARFGQLLREVMEALATGRWKRPPVEVFPAAAGGEALRKMARSEHVGKLVIDLSCRDGLPLVGSGEGPPPWAEGTWLVTGGLGGLGRSVAGWLAARGVRHVVLAGRSGASQPEQREALAWLVAAGVSVEAAALDVADAAAVRALVDDIARRRPPLRGILHAAVVLEDGLLREQRPQRFRSALFPKVLGAWNLHQATLGHDLDAFVLYSSVASTLGSPGQGNYMAGNAFLDALAHYRRSIGLPALSINWGTFTGAGGAAAEENRGERLAARGLLGMTASEGERWLGELLGLDVAQVTVAKIDARQWVEFHPQIAGSSWLSELTRASQPSATGAAAGLRERLAAAAPAERSEMAVAFVRQQAALVLRLDPDRLDPQAPLRSLGVDSLMGLELRNRLEAGLSLTLPATLIWNHPNVAALASNLLDRLGLGAAREHTTAPPPPSASGAALFAPTASEPAPGSLDTLSDEELMARLASKLDFEGDAS